MHLELVVAKLVVVFLGFTIAHQAFRSYRRGHGRTMLYVALGFAFISVAAVIEGILFELDLVSIYQASAVQTLIAALGMLFVLFSLYHGQNETKISTTKSDSR